MADYRNVHTHMWVSDEWFAGLDAEAKLLWIHLFTNPTASVAGIYRLPLRVICFETGIAPERVKTLMGEFEQAGKIMWDGEIVWVKKMRSYQTQGNPISIAKCIERDLVRIPDGPIKLAYLAYQDGKVPPPTSPQDGISVPPPLVRDETKRNETRRDETTPQTATAAPLDEDFGVIWTLYESEHLANPMSAIQREDIGDMVTLCRDVAIHREAIKRARRVNTRPSLGLIRKIVSDYLQSGSWDKPGGNGHGPPGKPATKPPDPAIAAALEKYAKMGVLERIG